MAKLLLVDDDDQLQSSLKQLLELEGYQVESALTGEDGLQLAQNFFFDLIILDWSMPGISGLEVCRQYRDGGGTALVLFLTGKSDVERKAQGLDSGADDYLIKPFSALELLARVRSLLRRPQALLVNNPSVDGFELDVKMRQLRHGQKQVSFSQIETRILELLLASPGRIFSSKDLFKLAWTSESDSSEQTVRVHIKAIRNKLAAANLPDIIQSNKGGGWFITGGNTAN